MMSPKKKEKRIIKVKHPQIQRFRTSLREVLKSAYITERRRLRGLSDSLDDSDLELWMEKKTQIEEKIRELDRARRAAPIGCRVCGRQDLDLVYNPYGSEWFCESCYTFNQEGYKKNPHPYEPDWRKLFP
jgi:hypothetical protein